MPEESFLVTIMEIVDCNSQIRRPQADRRGRAKPCGGILSPVNKMEVVDCFSQPLPVAPNDILSNLFLEDLEKIWELKKWIPDPCNPHLHDLKQQDDDEE